MFRVSQFMHELRVPTPVGPRRNLPGPVVIWNLIRRCNLTCRHCYSISTDKDFSGELSTAEAFAVMDDLRRFKVPVLVSDLDLECALWLKVRVCVGGGALLWPVLPPEQPAAERADATRARHVPR